MWDSIGGTLPSRITLLSEVLESKSKVLTYYLLGDFLGLFKENCQPNPSFTTYTLSILIPPLQPRGDTDSSAVASSSRALLSSSVLPSKHLN